MTETAKSKYDAYRLGTDGRAHVLCKGDIVVLTHPSGPNEDWTYQGTFHPRKVTVTSKEDPNGDDFWPNLLTMTYYASVLDLGIWDNYAGVWTFEPDWDNYLKESKDAE